MTQKKNKGVFIYIIVVLVLLGIIFGLARSFNSKGESYDESEIMKYFDDLKVKKFTFDLNSGNLTMTVDTTEEDEKKAEEDKTTEAKDNKTDKDKKEDKHEKVIKYKVPSVVNFNNQVLAGDDNYRVRYNEANKDTGNTLEYNTLPVKDNSMLITMLPSIILLGLMVVFFVIMMKQANGGGKIGNFGKSNAKNHLNVGKKATFDDVAGCDEEKEELQEVVDFLKNSKKYDEIGARVPKGVLLLGPPGTGKTLLARAVAGEAGVPFFSISGSDFVEMFVGVGASRVRDLFSEAKKNAPAIIFIDEIDAVGRQRGTGLGGGHDEREQTLNQLLVEMDGFIGNEGIIVMAATNRRDVLDPALLRPGRFDRQILVSYPDVKGREEILKVHTRNMPLAPDVDLKTIAKSTVGFTGADLENLANEAGLLAARKNRKAITKADMEEASIKVVAGPEKKSKTITEKEKKLTAYHEGGHAIATYYCEENDKVHQVSIIPRGGAGGFTMSLPEEDRSYISKNEMKSKIIVLLGGRVAEKLILDDISTGASNDLERATSMARSMVMRYGFSEKLGPVVYGTDEHEVFLGRDFNSNRGYSENVAAEIDSEIRSLIEDGYQGAEDILTAHMDKLHFIAKYLMHFEKIDGKDFEKLMKGEMTEEIFNNVSELENKTGENIGEKLDVTVEKSDEAEKIDAESKDDSADETKPDNN